MLYDSLEGLGRVLLVGTLAYVGLVALLRVSGKRTLTKMNAFDLVVTVALGSTLASVILTESVALAEGLLALALLVLLQYCLTWLSVRFPGFKRVVKSQPTLLFYRGEMLQDSLRSQRVTAEEVRAAVRAGSIGRLQDVEAVVLETDGTFSVLPKTQPYSTSASDDVPGYPPPRPDTDRQGGSGSVS